MKILATVIAIVVVSVITTMANAQIVPWPSPVCTSAMSKDDVVAIDYDQNGVATEYHRTEEDAKKVVKRLQEKAADDSAITQSKYWRNEMLTIDYWLKTACGGTTSCSSKACSGNAKCTYSNIGMAGCKCF